MVSKIAVIALVAIVSVPILLGYAMNLQEVTVTDYKETGDPVNVTPLYQNGTGYTNAFADIYNLNTNFTQGYGKVPVLPDYQSIINTKSSMIMSRENLAAGQNPGEYNLAGWQYIYIESDFNGISTTKGYLTLQIWDVQTNSPFAAEHRIHSVYWDQKTKNIDVTYYPYNDDQVLLTHNWPITLNMDRYLLKFFDSYDVDGGATPHYNWTGFIERALVSTDPYFGSMKYVDFSAGFLIDLPVDLPDDSYYHDQILLNNMFRLNLPEYPNNVLITMDLNTITASSHDVILQLQGYGSYSVPYTISKTTDSEGVHWTLNYGRPYIGSTKIADLYYDSSRLSNTYQLLVKSTGIEMRYVGNWPTVIGEANAYQTYTYNRDVGGGLRYINFLTDSPKMRIDGAEYRAFEYPIIEDQSYNPADFKSNPATTISGNVMYGKSITFAGTTYNVTDGNIMLGTHKIPVKGIVFDSIPNSDGNYDNRINGTKVSESANPATIRFNGQWSASIATVEQERYTYTKTEWVAGSFGWDGIDHNFLMVGLLTSFAAFVGLGIYARKTRSGGVIPLLIVTGSATVLFFLML